MPAKWLKRSEMSPEQLEGYRKRDREYKKLHYERYKEAIAARGKRRYEAKNGGKQKKVKMTPEEKKQRRKELLTPEKLAARKASQKKWREKERQKLKEKKSAYAKQHRESMTPEQREVLNAYHREWKKRNPEIGISATHRRVARLKGCEGNHTAQEWKDLVEKHDHTCVHCRRREPEIKLTRDHIIPVTRGGSNWITNIQPLCKSCNSRKNNKMPFLEAA